MNSRERRAQAYRAKCAADNKFGRKVEAALTGCSDRVLKAVSCTEYKMKMRSKPVPEAVTRENPEYRKVNNPYGQVTNARQKMRGKSIPLI
ncbi:hypothetical protein [Erwinia phyllosphaerae]|uniref:hypothetical protein n=1 Tax=Erwinia phyllosphaerae TaxID=2853256 RepID=UPI001FEDB5A2|nr:hypothetical protein [Erwinia phyllosphaerae]MBV4365880.1 hypothetical protein [Erwinia phyllosphaerae]